MLNYYIFSEKWIACIGYWSHINDLRLSSRFKKYLIFCHKSLCGFSSVSWVIIVCWTIDGNSFFLAIDSVLYFVYFFPSWDFSISTFSCLYPLCSLSLPVPSSSSSCSMFWQLVFFHTFFCVHTTTAFYFLSPVQCFFYVHYILWPFSFCTQSCALIFKHHRN